MFFSKIDHKLKPAMISRSANGWELIRISNKRLSCDNQKLSADDIRRIEDILKDKFEKKMEKRNVYVSHDSFSGVFIMQMPGRKFPKADRLIKEIYEYLKDTDM
ncbi:MAG: hypothetical protein J6W58_04530 [Lachnospiraceae bacterium]|nr:hypothetical protein [Lachnospiraceae bacterium]MBP5745550.1 hypothetical protein [Lachnospiraceae bacterium]